MKKDREPQIGGYKVVAQVDFSKEQKRKFHLATPEDPLFVTVEGVEARTAVFVGKTESGDALVKLYDSRENAQSADLHLLDPIIQVSPDKVKEKLKT